MSLATDEDDNQMECVLRALPNDMVSKRWAFEKWLSSYTCNNAFKINDEDTVAMVRLRQALSRDPDALHALFDMFASAVCSESMNKLGSNNAAWRCLSLSAVNQVHSFDALRARVEATTGGIPAPELIEHLLSKVDAGGNDGGDDGNLNFRSAPFPSCVVAAVGSRFPLQNSFTFAMGPARCDYDDSGHGEGLFVYVPVTSTAGAYDALIRWPMKPEVGASEDLHAALAMARWIDSWGDTSLFGGGRYRSVLVCHARRSTFNCRLPYEIGPPRYLVVCTEQSGKTEQCFEQKPDNCMLNKYSNHAVHFPLDLPWQPLVLGALVLIGGYMTYRYGVSAVWQPTYHWRIGALMLCRPSV